MNTPSHDPGGREIQLADRLAFEVFYGRTDPETDLEKATEGLDPTEAAGVINYVKGKVAYLQDKNKNEDQEKDALVEKIIALKPLIIIPQYPQMISALIQFGTDTTGAPSQNDIDKALTDEVIQKAAKMQRPTLLLIPPTTRASKIRAINNFDGEERDEYGDDFDDETGGPQDIDQPEPDEVKKEWRAAIVEGVQNVDKDPVINDGEKTVAEMCRLWVGKYAAKGLDVMNDKDSYLTLLILYLVEGKNLDSNSFTVLDAKRQSQSRYVDDCYFNQDERKVIDYGQKEDAIAADGSRVRALIELDVPQI